MWSFTGDVAEFARHAEPYLLEDPVRNTVALTVLDGLRTGLWRGEDLLAGWWTSGGRVRGAAYRTPPFPLGLTVMPVEAVVLLMAELSGRDIPKIHGPRLLVEAAVAHLGRPAREVQSQCLYRLATLVPPQGVPGRGRVATGEDLELLVRWLAAFDEEAGEGRKPDHRRRVGHRVARGDMLLWEDAGEPVAVAGISAACGGVSRIGPVYTPPYARGRGYGSAVTAFASRTALEQRCEQVVLFTDLANPTSNKIYQRIGFEPVGPYAVMSL
ncbi:GNAT family N-acetyltransferase [Thermoactinospora rubra]|uniref:GNAT family N-acetyltransferase n=1 Tax=Thermoactinospora rubra TaxID=1088767 RepID=UPI000A1102AC|nr:GNAT family N-acetyltransferase [Thermoactinospora rubra]